MEIATKIETRRRKGLGVFSAIAIGVIGALYASIVIGFYLAVQNGWLVELWSQLEGDGRASILSAAITAVGLLSSAVVLPFVFQDRISSLSDMVDRTEKDLGQLTAATRVQLDALAQTVREETDNIKVAASADAKEAYDLQKAIYAAVTSLLGQGQVADRDHAARIVNELWEKAKYVCRVKLDNQPYLRAERRASIRQGRQMSRETLAALVDASVITGDERDKLLTLRSLRYARAAPEPSEFGVVRDLQKWVAEFEERAEAGGAQ